MSQIPEDVLSLSRRFEARECESDVCVCLVRSGAWKSQQLARDEYESSRSEGIHVPIHWVRLVLTNKLPEDHDTYCPFELRSFWECNSRPTCDSRKTQPRKSKSFLRTVY